MASIDPSTFSLDHLRDRANVYSSQDTERARYIEDLLNVIAKLEKKKEFEVDLSAKDALITKLQAERETAPFVLVLIDADIILFREDFIADGVEGGESAARQLRDSLKQKLSGIADHWKIIIRVYANISGLGRTYVESGVIANDTLWKHFVHGFNRSSQWHEFVDAGRDKEAADNRIKAYFELFHPNQHCKRIVLGVSGDNSYAGFLRDHITGDGTVPGLALLEALPFPTAFREIAAKNTTFKLDAIFRMEKLQIQAQHSNGPARDSKASTSNAPATYANMAQATQVGTNKPPQAKVVESRAVEQPTLTSLRQSQLAMPKKIQFNINGHRIDERIVPDASQMTKLKKLKLCNRHFLTQCAFGDCKHSHNYPHKLDKKAIDTLRFIARLSQCRDKYCDDILCVGGHQCPYNDLCVFRRNCHFDPDRHGMDKKVDDTKTIHLTV